MPVATRYHRKVITCYLPILRTKSSAVLVGILPVYLLIYRYVLLSVIVYYLSRLDFFHIFSCELALSCRVLTFLTGRQSAAGADRAPGKFVERVVWVTNYNFVISHVLFHLFMHCILCFFSLIYNLVAIEFVIRNLPCCHVT